MKLKNQKDDAVPKNSLMKGKNVVIAKASACEKAQQTEDVFDFMLLGKSSLIIAPWITPYPKE